MIMQFILMSQYLLTGNETGLVLRAQRVASWFCGHGAMSFSDSCDSLICVENRTTTIQVPLHYTHLRCTTKFIPAAM